MYVQNTVTKQVVTKEDEDGKIVMTARKLGKVVSLEFIITIKTPPEETPLLSFNNMIPVEYRPNQSLKIIDATEPTILSINPDGSVSAVNATTRVSNVVFTYIKD